MPMLDVDRLSVRYGTKQIVDALSFSVSEGQWLMIAGPNGAGKSTTMKMLLGLTAPTKGSFTIDGKQFPQDRIAILKEIGSFIEAPSAFWRRTTLSATASQSRRSCALGASPMQEACSAAAGRTTPGTSSRR